MGRHLLRPRLKQYIHERQQKSPTWQHNGTWLINGVYFANNPNLGSDLLTNGDMETGSPPSSWTAQNSATLASVSDERTGGSGTKSISVLNSVASAGYANQVLSSAALNDWVQFGGWVRRNAGTNGVIVRLVDSGLTTIGAPPTYTSATWAQVAAAVRITGSNPQLWLRNSSGTLSDEGRFDDIYTRLLTLNELMILRTGAANFSYVRANLTIAANFGGLHGVIASVDSLSNPQNFVLAVHDGISTLYLIKRVSGTYTALLTVSTGYVVTQPVEIRKTSNTVYQLWYRGSQRGTDQTVSDATVKDNTLHGGFSTISGNSLVNIKVV